MSDGLLTEDGLNASGKALDDLIETSRVPDFDPKEHIHQPAPHPKAHAWLQKVLPASTLEVLETKYHLGNYVIDRQTGEKSFEAMSVYVRLGMHLLYYGSAQSKLLHTSSVEEMLKDKSEKMGVQYDAPESKAHIRPFIDSFQLQESLVEMVKPDPDSYSTFNEFFGRAILPSARPIASPASSTVVSSPADCRLTAFPTIDLATKYWIKGFGFTLARLLDSDALAETFDGGSIVIARLAPQDYHRWHAPVSGVVESVKDVPGTYYTVNPQAINEATTLDVFAENKRSVMTLKSKATGSPVAVIAVGAMLVGSIKYVGGVEAPGTEVERGQCLGAFYYGGSTVIVVYPKGEVAIDEDLVKNSSQEHCETYMRVGWQVGEYKA